MIGRIHMTFNPNAKKLPPEKRLKNLLDEVEADMKRGIFNCNKIKRSSDIQYVSSDLRLRAKRLFETCMQGKS